MPHNPFCIHRALRLMGRKFAQHKRYQNQKWQMMATRTKFRPVGAGLWKHTHTHNLPQAICSTVLGYGIEFKVCKVESLSGGFELNFPTVEYAGGFVCLCVWDNLNLGLKVCRFQLCGICGICIVF